MSKEFMKPIEGFHSEMSQYVADGIYTDTEGGALVLLATTVHILQLLELAKVLDKEAADIIHAIIDRETDSLLKRGRAEREARNN